MPNSYNLIDEPFISYFKKDGSVGRAGILDIFKNAKTIARIGGDSEIQELPLMRLLLAVMYRALDDVQTKAAWETTWKNGIPAEKIEAYLNKHRNRFDLLHPETPFYQIIGASYVKKDKKPTNLDLLIDHQALGNGSGRFLFSSYKPSGYKELSFDVAARKLIELQAFNTGSKKSTLVGDTRTKKYGYAQPGWLGNFTGVMLLGKNLEQTLLLNFIPYQEWGTTIEYDKDCPVWEREQQTAAGEGVHGDMDESRLPYGPADLYTHQISRVSLDHNGEKITSAVVGIGDRLFKYNMHHLEPMASWRNITRQDKTTAWVPVSIRTTDSWKAVNALFGEAKTQNEATREPMIFDWFSSVRRTVKRELGTRANLVVFNSEYGTQDAIIESQSVSTMTLPQDAIVNFMGESPALTWMIKAIQLAEVVASNYKVLLADLFISEGKKPSIDKGITPYQLATPQMEEIYHEIGEKYNEWLVEVTNDNALEKFLEWRSFIEKMMKTKASKAVENASRSALAGHAVSGSEEKKFMSAYVALNKFEATLFKTLKKNDSERNKNG